MSLLLEQQAYAGRAEKTAQVDAVEAGEIAAERRRVFPCVAPIQVQVQSSPHLEIGSTPHIRTEGPTLRSEGVGEDRKGEEVDELPCLLERVVARREPAPH